ncbi:MAG: molybdate ABC transporter substrate-binding protein [Nitrospiraceae bacterium]|nr:molybdate ABC transporter substrate-binding protein [Nitrospiraceae bacterium]
MLKRLLPRLLVFVLVFVFAGLSLAEEPQGITVSAAISLKNAFEEIGKLYESRNAGSRVMFNFGASGDLMAQIKGGAPVDVFASAAQKDMDELDNAGLVVKDTRTNFAANSVVLIVPLSSKIAITSFNDLQKAEVKKIAVGNPKTVPVGRYTDEAFQYYKVSDMIKDKLVFAENVRQVLDYVARGEVDAGVVYSTDAMVKQQKVSVVMAAQEASHKPVVYPIAVVKGSKNENAARAFISFVRSEEGRKILEKYGFKPLE